MEIEHNTDVRSILELSDLKIAIEDGDGYITLFSIDYEKEQWTKIKEHQGHDKSICSLCELSVHILITSSWDKTLKVWNISNDNITHIKTLERHKHYVNKVIHITNNNYFWFI